MNRNIKLYRYTVVFIFIVVIIFSLWKTGILVFDYSADIALERVIWKGREYSNVSGDYSEGRTIARSKKPGWEINMVEEDPSHTFIVARSFLDQTLLVADDYVVPTAGRLTAVSWNGNYIYDVEFLTAISQIDTEKTTSFSYQTDAIYMLTENQHMRRLYFAYENCPVTTNYKGYMGKVNDEWMITTYIPKDTRNSDGSPKKYTVECYKIPSQHWEILSKYFS